MKKISWLVPLVALITDTLGASFELSAQIPRALTTDSASISEEDHQEPDADLKYCNLSLELTLLQDNSNSFSTIVSNYGQRFKKDVVNRLHNIFGEDLKVGISSFIDKPVPLSGVGNYLGYSSEDYVMDYCYRHSSPLSNNLEIIERGIDHLESNLGSGGSFREDQNEALIFAALDKDMGWTDPSISYTVDGKKITRVILLVTDDLPHKRGDYRNNVRNYELPRTFNDRVGGFGSKSFVGNSFINKRYTSHYSQLSAYYKKMEVNRKELTPEEKIEFDTLLALLGPEKWHITPIDHPGDNSIDCMKTDYPDVSQARARLLETHIHPIILVKNPNVFSHPSTCSNAGFPDAQVSAAECFQHLYANDWRIQDSDLKGLGNDPFKYSLVVEKFTEEDVFNTIVNTIVKLGGELCKNVAPENTEAQHTTEIQTTNPETTNPGDNTTENITSSSNNGGDESSTEDESDDEDGLPLGAVVGAAGAGLAAVGGVAGTLYAKGMLFNGGSAPSMENIAQVESPDATIEREAMENVSVNMFQ